MYPLFCMLLPRTLLVRLKLCEGMRIFIRIDRDASQGDYPAYLFLRYYPCQSDLLKITMKLTNKSIILNGSR